METNGSLWSLSASTTVYGRIEDDIECDVVIVGAGITGISAAYWLALAGKRVVVLEARRVGLGVTHRTTAHLTEAVDTRYHEIAARFGNEGATLVAEASRSAIESVYGLAQLIDCDFARRPGFLYTERDEDVAELQKEHTAAVNAGLPVELLSFAPLPFDTKAALRFPDQAQFHPQRYLLGLTEAARGVGAQIFEESRVIAIDDGEPCTVHVEHGPTIRAGHVFVATHAPLNRVFLQTKVYAYRSYVVAYSGVNLADGLFWDTEAPYHYFSSFKVGDVPWMILGGADHKTGAHENTEERFDLLKAWVRAHGLAPDILPELRWSAQVEEPVDGLPFIGRNSLSTNVFVATGFSGNGMTFGTIAAMIIRDAILGRANPWAELFTATRIKPSSAGTFVGENVDFPIHLVSDWIKPPQAESTNEIARGEGKTVRVNGERLAVYRDTGGKLHAVSAVCTHLGCEVKFNSAETTWDCPCHGSRFGVNGSVIDGPAVRPLAIKDVEQRHSSAVMPKVTAARSRKRRTAGG